MVLAVFLIFSGVGVNTIRNDKDGRNVFSRIIRPALVYADSARFNPLAIPELRQPVVPVLAPPVVNTIPTANDPRLDTPNSPHRLRFVPASELKPPEPSMSIPILDTRPPGYSDMNEWEEDKVFNSNLYTDTSFYSNQIDGNESMSSKDEGEFYEENLHYDLFSTNNNGDSLSLVLDTTTTNDKRPYEEEFNLNQLTLESRTQKSLLVFGHANPEMSQYSMTHNMVGFYGTQKYDNTKIGGFAGYYALNKDDLKNPRKVAGVRLEHSKDRSFKLGLNVVGTEDDRVNAGSNPDLPTLSNKVYSVDMHLKPTENIFMNAEVAQSTTDFDKKDQYGAQTANAYKVKGGYERENFRAEGGIEQAGTAFLTALGESPRDERAYFARFYYELNEYISTRFSERLSKDNLSNYQRSTIVRDQPELQVSFKPSKYYKDLKIDLFYQPLHEYAENSNFMNHFRDIYWMEMNQKAGQMRYFAGFSQTIDKDDINVLNDHDVQKMDFNMTWEYDQFRQVYTNVSLEKFSYKRAGGIDESKIYGIGGKSLFHDDITLGLDFLREVSDLSGMGPDSVHNRVNVSLTKEYNNSSRLTLEFEGSDNKFEIVERNFKDYMAKLRYLRAF